MSGRDAAVRLHGQREHDRVRSATRLRILRSGGRQEARRDDACRIGLRPRLSGCGLASLCRYGLQEHRARDSESDGPSQPQAEAATNQRWAMLLRSRRACSTLTGARGAVSRSCRRSWSHRAEGSCRGRRMESGARMQTRPTRGTLLHRFDGRLHAAPRGRALPAVERAVFSRRCWRACFSPRAPAPCPRRAQSQTSVAAGALVFAVVIVIVGPLGGLSAFVIKEGVEGVKFVAGDGRERRSRGARRAAP